MDGTKYNKLHHIQRTHWHMQGAGTLSPATTHTHTHTHTHIHTHTHTHTLASSHVHTLPKNVCLELLDMLLLIGRQFAVC